MFNFNKPPTTTSQSTGLFGAPLSTNSVAQGSLFAAQPTSQPTGSSLFGQQPTGGLSFGANQQNSAVGNNNSLFGPPPTSQPPSSNLFGGSTSTASGIFGASASTAPATGLFGAPASTASGIFGAPTSTTGLFGAAARTAPAAGVFGAPLSTNSVIQSSLFTTQPTSQAVGSSLFTQPPTGGLSFGAPTSTATGLFGAAASTAPAAGVFGAPLSTNSVIQSSLFTTQPTSQAVGSSLFTQPPTGGLSFGAPTSTTGLFGAAARTAPAAGVFGAPLSTNSVAQSNLFASQPTSQAVGSSLFTQPPTGGLSFGAPTSTATGLLGAPVSTSSTTGLLGTSTPAVSSTLTTTSTIQPMPSFGSNLFGSGSSSSPAPKLFGASVVSSVPPISASTTPTPALPTGGSGLSTLQSLTPSTTQSTVKTSLSSSTLLSSTPQPSVQPTTALTTAAPAAPQTLKFREMDGSLNKMIGDFENQHLAYKEHVEAINRYDQQILQNQRGLESFDRDLGSLEEEKEAFAVDVRMILEMQSNLAQELTNLEQLVKLPLNEPEPSSAERSLMSSAAERRHAALRLLSDVSVQYNEVEDQLEEASEMLSDLQNQGGGVDGDQSANTLEQIRRILRVQWQNMERVENETDVLAKRVQEAMARAMSMR